MEFDGARVESNYEVAMQRLVARNPNLRDNLAIQALNEKGSCLKAEDAVDVLAELFLQPDLTVSIIGCFRSLSVRIINTLVGWLLRIQSSGELGDDHEKHDSTKFFQIRLHLTRWSLKLHEYAVIAFSRSLELAPFLLRPILKYFSFAPPPFQRLMQFNIPIAMTQEESFHLLDVVRASYRLLHLETKVFSRLWDWSPFLELLQWSCDVNKLAISSETVSDVRWCAIQVLSVVLRISDEATRYLGHKLSGMTEEMAFACLLRWEEFCQDVALEKAGWYLESKQLKNDVFLDKNKSFLVKCDPSLVNQQTESLKSYASNLISHLDTCGMELSIKQSLQHKSPQSTASSFVMTSNMKKILEVVILAVNQSQPVLLEGPVGVGKTTLINELARTTGKSDVLFIHLDEQMDSKTLIGTYICTEIPGEFKWQPGSLTQAVVNGFWVVFEDVDKAPSDILSVIAPLLEDNKLYIPGRREAISAAEGFQLFATITKFQSGSAHAIPGKETFSKLWRKVVIEATSSEDLIKIVKVCFPDLKPVASKLIDTLYMVNSIAASASSSYTFGSFASVYSADRFSTRDLLKWCKRVTDLNLNFDGDCLSSHAWEHVCHACEHECNACTHVVNEAVDIFAASIACQKSRVLLMRKIAKLWNIPLSQVEYLDQLNRPQIQVLKSELRIGRISLLQRKCKITRAHAFANTGSALRTLERIACSVKHNEPILLVGETGTGKTTLVQHLAMRIGMPLTVLNLSQQSDSTDFLGGFKPIESQSICFPLVEVFNRLFCSSFPSEQNVQFLVRIQQFVEKKKWDQLLKAFQMAVEKVGKLVSQESCRYVGLQPEVTNGEGTTGSGANNTRKRKKSLDRKLLQEWCEFSLDLHRAQRQIEASKTSFAFSFMEGALVKAMRNGHWILLDEVNLAPAETLQRLSGVLEGDKGSFCLTEKGDVEYVTRHLDFRLFACMNPATDVGKRDLPFCIKNRFTEFFVDELLNEEDLSLLISQYLEGMLPSLPVDDIVRFYKEARKEADTRLFDGANQKPQYSLRSLARALEYTRAATPIYGFQRALYDGISMLFLTLLDHPSSIIMERLIALVLLKESEAMAMKGLNSFFMAPPCPSPNHVQFEEYWIEKGTSEVSKLSTEFCKRYVLTKTIKGHLKNLARAVFIRKYPVLLQGPTSSGKTSLIEYLATITGHRFVRINNHEHTDIQEYLGRYVTDSSGKLVFQEGILVEAVRKGYWIVLDELNLAPSDVLEALNRLLDDNRELFVPELQMMVKPHPHFMLFATQNPPGTYGGRKVLSRAFRNRFLELHVDDIPGEELCMILEKRCEVPPSYANRMVEIMKDLQRHRQSSNVFAGKHGFITPRDLFRWADRFRRSGKSYEDLAKDGYILLAERLRDESEKAVVQEILEKHLRVKIDIGRLYLEDSTRWQEVMNLSMSSEALATLGKIVWTKSLRRLFYLLERCYEQREPVLLVGETGCGKTTICQLLSLVLKCHLHILNCHQHTESSDFLGDFRPVRERNRIAGKFEEKLQMINSSELFNMFHKGEILSSNIEDADVTLGTIRHVLRDIKSNSLLEDNSMHSKLYYISKDEIEALEIFSKELVLLHRDWQSLFLWHDGPLVQAMKNGQLFLVDEISLADDSVLERLNSVLEPSRILVLAEKGGPVLEEWTAHPQFFLLATMNPGGDFGKKELSPALRNRFTEIFVPPITDLEDLRNIALNRFSKPELLHLANPLLNFWKWFQKKEIGRVLTVRDLLSWIAFVNIKEKDIGSETAFMQGAYLVLLDGLSLGSGMTNNAAEKLKDACVGFLLQEFAAEGSNSCTHNRGENYGLQERPKFINMMDIENDQTNVMFGIDPFYIMKGVHADQKFSFELSAPTTSKNGLRILRAMQLHKPVLLEGSPGVGKTSLVAALASFSNHNLVRINLSEQTDIMDLLGSDLPVEGTKGIEFQWSDGILLQSLKAGSWVLLDELNLAPQSVLEGLNALLDHRAEVYIPELGRSFKCPSSFRIFACQNPSHQGGGRKGLPKSFLNRFTKVFVDALHEDDFLFVSSALYPSIPGELLKKLINFNARVHDDITVHCKFGQIGSPWEFNLRDILRSCHLIQGARGRSKDVCFLNVIYLQRMRTEEDRRQVLKLYQEVFGVHASINAYPKVNITPKNLFVGEVTVPRNTITYGKDLNSKLQLLPGFANSLEAVTHCVEQGWMCILVGPSSSGKTSMIRLLAELTGNMLHEYNLSEGTDTSELLGCFEQYDAFRYWHDTIIQSQSFMEELCAACLGDPATVLSAENSKFIVKDLLGRWSAFQNHIKTKATMTDFSARKFDKSIEHQPINHLSIHLLMKILEHLKEIVSRITISVSWSVLDIDKLMKMLRKFEESLDMKGIAGHFEWINGGLVKALECGEWVVLENANLCNPTVLDRLNSLLEPSGSITVNERGLLNGEPMVVKAHTKFRLFLTVNPNYGEVSRAMRNRGVEIYLMQPNWLLLSKSADNKVNKSDIQDLKRLLTLSGIPLSNLIDAMANAHESLKNEVSCFGIDVSLHELSQWIQLFQQLLMRGGSLSWSLYSSWEQIYLYFLYKIEARNAAFRVMKHHLSDIEIIVPDNYLKISLSLPGGWPTPLELKKYLQFSKEAIVKRDCMYLEFLGAQFTSIKISLEGKFNSKMERQDKEDGFLLWLKNKQLSPLLFPSYFLRYVLFPSSLSLLDIASLILPGFDSAVIEHMLFSAASWMIDQACFSDLDLRMCWLSWYASKVASYCPFFNLFVTVTEKVNDHLVTKCLASVWQEIKLIFPGNLDLEALPYLSTKSIESVPSSEETFAAINKLKLLLKMVSTLRRITWQWMIEDEASNAKNSLNNNSFSSLTGKIYMWLHPVLMILRELENDILTLSTSLVCDKNVDDLFAHVHELFMHVRECHSALWKSVNSPTFDADVSLICWDRLKKFVVRMVEYLSNKEYISKVFERFMQASKNLDAVLCLGSDISKPLLWKYAGHPMATTSSEHLNQQQRLLDFCLALWPLAVQQGLAFESGKLCLEEISVSANVDLRYLTVQGVTMALCIGDKGIADNSHEAVSECKEICKMLSKKYEEEKASLGRKRKMLTSPCASSNHLDECFPSDILCFPSAYKLWVQLLPLPNIKSLRLDLILLKALSECLVPYLKDHHQCQASLTLRECTRKALSLGLESTSRSPLDFVSHQKCLWMIDAQPLEDIDITRFSSMVHDMWFRWHSALWILPHNHDVNNMTSQWNESQDHLLLFKATKTALLSSIVEPLSCIKDHSVKHLQLKVASTHMWRYSKFESGLCEFVLCTASFLFQQIILVHSKSFNKEDTREIQSILFSLHQNISKVHEGFNPQMLDRLKFLLKASSHQGLAKLVDSFVQSLIQALYLSVPITGTSLSDYQFKLAQVWLFLGGLRLRLLVNSNTIDPVKKSIHKYSQLLEKISYLEIEIKVRQECETLTEGNQAENEDQKEHFEELKRELQSLASKVVYRPDTSKFKALNTECIDFLKSMASLPRLEILMNQLQDGAFDLQLTIPEVRNWQEISTSFIYRLSEEYAPYIDIVQPIQLAIYELKFGLSLAVEAALEKRLCNLVGVNNIYKILEILSLLMDFPSRSMVSMPSIETSNGEREIMYTPHCQQAWMLDGEVLKLLSAPSLSGDANKEVVDIKLKVAILRICLVRAASSILQSLNMDKYSMQLLNTIFASLTTLWVEAKEQMKDRAHHEAEAFKFKPRSCTIEDELEIDEVSFGKLFAEECWVSEQRDILLEPVADQDNSKVTRQEHENLEEIWTSIEEALLEDVVKMHGRLFGSTNLVHYFQKFQISDDERLHAFTLAYETGKKFIEGAGYSLPAELDDTILSGHLLHLCLAHEKLSQSSYERYNIYKDSNTPEMVLMVEPLQNLRERLNALLKEWPEHPGLQQILQITGTLLDIPVNDPLMKALTGIQFLLHKSQLWEENAPRSLSLEGELQPLSSLVIRWRKIEFKCWPALLDAVERQHKVNADKLWFALHSNLFRRMSDTDLEIQSTISSLEEFMQTASVGEFRRRLELLLAFHGQFSSQICLDVYPTNTGSSITMKLSRITYNVFGYYIQFLPMILESIQAVRKLIEKELKDYSDLCKWDDHQYHSHIESSKKTHQKLRKLVQKYNDALERPVRELLSQEMKKIGSENLDSPEFKAIESEELPSQKQNVVTNTAWSDWQKNKGTEHHLISQMAYHVFTGGKEVDQQSIPVLMEKVVSYLNRSIFSKTAVDMRQEGQNSLEVLWRSVLHRAHDLRNTEINLSVKQKAFRDILELLRSIGLSHLKSAVQKEELEFSSQEKVDASSWFLQPYFNLSHLLNPETESTPLKMGFSENTNHFEELQLESNDSNWRLANAYYFKNMSLMQRLRQIYLKFDKHLSLREVNETLSFVEQLLHLQQEQRCTAYEFFSKLEKLSKLSLLLKDFASAGTVENVALTCRQKAIYKLMWDQKHLFDNLCTVSAEISLFLKAVGRVHNCPTTSIGREVKILQVLIDKFIPSLNNIKSSLDKYLLGSSLISVNIHSQPFIISKEMEEFVHQNFLELKKMQEDISALDQDCTVEDGSFLFLTRLSDLLLKGVRIYQEFISKNDMEGLSCDIEEFNASFVESHKETISEILIAAQNIKEFTDRVGYHKTSHVQVRSLAEVNMELVGTLQTWESLFHQQLSSLRLDKIHDALVKTIAAAVKLIDYGAQDKSKLCVWMGKMLGCLSFFVNRILIAGNTILFDYVNLHKTVSKMDYILSNIFASIYADGFCVTKEEPASDGDNIKFDDVSGTGMGEGEGVKDVSYQIQDEDQLLGGSDKISEEPSTSAKGPSETDKGVEMEQDFSAGDMFSVSQDSGDDSGNDDQDENLDSAMGKTGEDEEIVDEQLWNKEDDSQPENTKEKYETGASVHDSGTNSMELRAKQDMDRDETATEDTNEERVSKTDDMEVTVDSGVGDTINDIVEELTMNKDDAYTDPTGTQPDAEEEFNANDDMELDEPVDAEAEEEVPDSCMDDITAENDMLDDEHKALEDIQMDYNKQDENDFGAEQQQDEQIENKNLRENPSGGAEKSADTHESSLQIGAHHSVPDFQHIPNTMKSKTNDKASQRQQNGVISEFQDDVVLEDGPSEGPGSVQGVFSKVSSEEMPSALPDNGEQSTTHHNLPSSSKKESQYLERMNANPFRSIGDALKDWKERVKVSDNNSQDPNASKNSNKIEELEMDEGDEFQFVCEGEESNGQALGAATADQLDQNLNTNNSTVMEEDMTGIESARFATEAEEQVDAQCNSIIGQNVKNMESKIKTDKQHQDAVIANDSSLPQVIDGDMDEAHENQERNQPESFVSIEKQHHFKVQQANGQLATDGQAWREEDMSNLRRDIEVILKESQSNRENAAMTWAKYDQLTARVSQELAEQLRLIMEPTLASRLQGDYQTGKRINMKKVIPYIASQFRKDKIWLRRTKPNKRQYQVVLAIDDSRSMSENHCGHMALEALITICKAMSLLEVGQLAVASFGEKGNVHLLHDFDQPFSNGAGLEMISKFSFKQDNTIADEPVVDLLNYLTRLLNHVGLNSRASSGPTEIQQLVLIIADGRFHEKESLRRCVRDALSRKQLLAFILLDNSEESIMDVQSVSFTRGVPMFSKYLDSFPFPYYIILKNIAALPRTLADLMRQWFELMQTTNI